jgi:hypothetical protein
MKYDSRSDKLLQQKVAGVKGFRAVAHQRSRSSHSGAEEREYARWNEV